LEDVNLVLGTGSFHFLTGPSGSGKTSLLNLLALTAKPVRGQITMNDTVINRLPREALPKYRRKIGVVSQAYDLLAHMTIAENIALPLKVAGESPAEIAPKVEEMLEWIGLINYRDAYPDVLSGGQRQRVAIARAVITKPHLLLADEPTGSLDPALAHRFIYLFEALNQMGTTVLIATHDEHLISLFDYPVLKLADGRIVP
jgi:cell division transport system ATP-binding protein